MWAPYTFLLNPHSRISLTSIQGIFGKLALLAVAKAFLVPYWRRQLRRSKNWWNYGRTTTLPLACGLWMGVPKLATFLIVGAHAQRRLCLLPPRVRYRPKSISNGFRATLSFVDFCKNKGYGVKTMKKQIMLLAHLTGSTYSVYLNTQEKLACARLSASY